MGVYANSYFYVYNERSFFWLQLSLLMLHILDIFYNFVRLVYSVDFCIFKFPINAQTSAGTLNNGYQRITVKFEFQYTRTKCLFQTQSCHLMLYT